MSDPSLRCFFCTRHLRTWKCTCSTAEVGVLIFQKGPHISVIFGPGGGVQIFWGSIYHVTDHSGHRSVEYVLKGATLRVDMVLPQGWVNCKDFSGLVDVYIFSIIYVALLQLSVAMHIRLLFLPTTRNFVWI